MTADTKPIGNRILIDPLPDDIKTSGGIFISPTVSAHTKKGIVVEIGTGGFTPSGAPLPIPVEIGDKVMFWNMAGGSSAIEVTDRERKLLIVDASALISIDRTPVIQPV